MSLIPEVTRAWPQPWSGHDPLNTGVALPGDESVISGQATVALPLGVLSLSGRGALQWLNSFSSQLLTELAPGSCTETLLLTAHGKIQAQGFIHRLPTQANPAGSAQTNSGAALAEDLLILTENPTGLAEFLTRMKFGVKVKITNLSEQVSVWGLVYNGTPGSSGQDEQQIDDPQINAQNVHEIFATISTYLAGKSDGQDQDLPAALCFDPWPGPVGDTTVYTAPPAPDVAPDAWLARSATDHPGMLTRFAYLVLPATPEQAQPVWGQAGLRIGTLASWEAARIAAWRPREGTEADPRSLPHETDWLRTAVHLHKGCYAGQETVAKIVNLGAPPRRLVFLDFDGTQNELPESGTELTDETGKTVGVLTSVAYHPREGVIGLGLVRRTLAPAATLQAGNMLANQTVIVNENGDNPRKKGRPQLSSARRERTRIELGLAPGAGGIAGECSGTIPSD